MLLFSRSPARFIPGRQRRLLRQCDGFDLAEDLLGEFLYGDAGTRRLSDKIVRIDFIERRKISHIRKEERRTQYVADCKKDSGRYEISLYALEANDHGERCSGEELIEDTAIDIESTAIHRIELEKLYQAVQSLSEEEQELVARLYSKKPATIIDLSKEWNVHYSTISRKHKAVLRKLKRILKNF